MYGIIAQKPNRITFLSSAALDVLTVMWLINANVGNKGNKPVRYTYFVPESNIIPTTKIKEINIFIIIDIILST